MLDAEQAFHLAVAIVVMGAAAALWLALLFLRWLAWCTVRGYVRREIKATLRHAVIVKRSAKGQFAR